MPPLCIGLHVALRGPPLGVAATGLHVRGCWSGAQTRAPPPRTETRYIFTYLYVVHRKEVFGVVVCLLCAGMGKEKRKKGKKHETMM
jgi:hypothetical protein